MAEDVTPEQFREAMKQQTAIANANGWGLTEDEVEELVNELLAVAENEDN